MCAACVRRRWFASNSTPGMCEWPACYVANRVMAGGYGNDLTRLMTKGAAPRCFATIASRLSPSPTTRHRRRSHDDVVAELR